MFQHLPFIEGILNNMAQLSFLMLMFRMNVRSEQPKQTKQPFESCYRKWVLLETTSKKQSLG